VTPCSGQRVSAVILNFFLKMEIVRKKFTVGRVRCGSMEHSKHCAVNGQRCITVCKALCT